MTIRRQFWVIGAEYESTEFARAVDGTARVHGPFASWQEASQEWREQSARSRHEALTRYTIVAEHTQQSATQS